MSSLPIIIPYYKNKTALNQCLLSISNSTYKDVEVFVRDNSTDNIYYTAAVNEGISKFAWLDTFKYLLILSQDAYLKPNTIDSLLGMMEANPDCGIACPIQISESTHQITYAGGLDAFPNGIHQTGNLSDYKQDFDTYWANGAAMLLRCSMIRQIGLLDNNLKFICSDSDYSFTARSRGWRVMVCANAFVNHAPNSSMQTNNTQLELIKVRDWIYFANKWLTGNIYKSFSFEGEKLSRMKINLALESFEKQIKYLSKN